MTTPPTGVPSHASSPSLPSWPADVLAEEITDRRHVDIDRAHATRAAAAHGTTVEAEYATRVLATAIYMISEAMLVAGPQGLRQQTETQLRVAIDLWENGGAA